jgi:hypothetical protein
MDYTRYQRPIATLFLVGGLLQSCGNLSWKLEETDGLHASPVLTNSRFLKPSQHSEDQGFEEATISCSESSDEVAHEVPSDHRSTSPATPAHILAAHIATPRHSPHLFCTATTARPVGHVRAFARHVANDLQCVVCDEEPLARHKLLPHTISRVVALLASPRNSVPIRLAASSAVTSPLSQGPPLKLATRAVAFCSASLGPFALASGREITFCRVRDHWQARVKEMWGTFCRETTLPILCKEDLSVVLHNLKDQEAVHAQSRIHILEVDQLPWAPRAVYVGAMALRGGMEKEARQMKEQAGTVQEPRKIDHVAASDLQFYAQSVSKALLLTHAPAARELATRTQLTEEMKMPSLSRVTAVSTLGEAQIAVEAYLERWSLETPAGREAIWKQGRDILKNVETLKKEAKRSYRRQVLGFEINDIDPLVWNRALQQQKAAKEQLEALRGLRNRLLQACQFSSQELREVGIRAIMSPPVAVGDIEYYSSDEEVQQLSDQSRRNHAAFVVGVGKVLQGRMKELLALLDEAIGTNMAPYIALLSSTPELPDLLGNYAASFLREENDEEREAELLGSLLAEAILQFVPLPKVKKTQLDNIKHKLGQAAQRVAIRHSDQLKKLTKTKTPN